MMLLAAIYMMLVAAAGAVAGAIPGLLLWLLGLRLQRRRDRDPGTGA